MNNRENVLGWMRIAGYHDDKCRFARACDTRTRLNRQAVASALGDGNGDSNA